MHGDRSIPVRRMVSWQTGLPKNPAARCSQRGSLDSAEISVLSFLLHSYRAMDRFALLPAMISLSMVWRKKDNLCNRTVTWVTCRIVYPISRGSLMIVSGLVSFRVCASCHTDGFMIFIAESAISCALRSIRSTILILQIKYGVRGSMESSRTKSRSDSGEPTGRLESHHRVLSLIGFFVPNSVLNSESVTVRYDNVCQDQIPTLRQSRHHPASRIDRIGKSLVLPVRPMESRKVAAALVIRSRLAPLGLAVRQQP